ncbi:MAG: HlyD family efflux transporter periplasmic adaptor subunit [Candidatus Riflebacteria bacterium]|nr:HlyD family efflux transporter periplasmic adaptor subunit [Candidatus Riflebacteria bacterium]
MSRHKYLNWQNLVIILVFATFVALAIFGFMRKKAALEKAQAMPQPPLAVKTINVEYGIAVRSVPALATVKSAATIQLKAETGGKITEMNYREGDRVAAGAVLAVINSHEQKAQLQAARARSDSASGQVAAMRASLQALTSQLDAYQINLDYWKSNLNRDQRLFKVRAQSQSALDATINRHAEAESRLEALKAQISSQKAQIAALTSQKQASEKDVSVWQTRLDYAEILAPVDGVISARLQEEGSLVQPGVAVYTIEDTSMTRLLIQVPQQEAARVQIGQAVMLKNINQNGFVISRVYPVQNDLRQITVEASMPGNLTGFAYDMQIPVRIVVENGEGVIIPPTASFINFNDSEQVFVYVIEGIQARRIALKPMMRADDGILVASADQLPVGTNLALGNYLENVRLPASFSVEVIK